MKKGLLSILAGALLVVGCQNYDDQFDALESQINALASTVAGLSQVQSDLASLSATVGSLQSAISGSIDTALADGLADIDAAVADLEAAADSAASAEDVQAIQDGVDANQASLAEILAQSSVFQGDVTVNTPATLDAYHAMGDGLAIVNGNVDIDVSASMDIAKVQELVDFITVTTGSFDYLALADVETEVTFSNLAGTATLTLNQKGGYQLQALESATVITLEDDSTADIIHLGSLISATSLSDGSGAGTFTFSKATELHLTALPRSPSTALSLGVDEGGVIDISALTDTTVAGKDAVLDLTIEGPSSLTITGLSGNKTGSDIIASEIVNLTVNGYDGKVTIGQDVANFSSDNLVDIAVTGDDLVTFTATGALNPNDTDDAAGPALTLDADGDLETVTLDGTFTTVTLSNNGNLTTATIGGTVTGAGGVNIDTNSDLTTLNISGLTTDKMSITGNSDLEELSVDFTTAAGEATTQEGSIKVQNNESMTNLVITTDNVDNLEITNNADLETIDLSGMTAIGATGTASVSIANNNLEASVADEENDTFTSVSGMATAKAYLDAVAADADSKANVVFDLVESELDADGDEANTDVADFVVLQLTPKVVTTPAQDATKHKLAFGVYIKGGKTDFGLKEPAGADLLVNGSEVAQVTLTLDANEVLAIAAIKRAAALTRATAYDLTLDAHHGFDPSGVIRITSGAATATAEYGFNLDKNAGVTTIQSGDYINLTIDGLTVSTTLSSNAALTTTQQLIARLVSTWTAQYGTSGAASYNLSLFTVSSPTAGAINIAAKTGSGRRGFDKAYSIAVVPATTVGVSTTLSAEYGATSAQADNKTISNGIVVTLESNIAGTLLDAVKNASVTRQAAASVVILTTTNKPVANVATTTSKNIYPEDARGDAVLPEAAVTEVATAATSKDRTAWL